MGKKLNLACNLSPASLVVCGTVVGGVTLNLVVLGTISRAGVSLKTYSKIINFKEKIELRRFAHTSFEKTLVDFLYSLCIQGMQPRLPAGNPTSPGPDTVQYTTKIILFFLILNIRYFIYQLKDFLILSKAG